MQKSLLLKLLVCSLGFLFLCDVSVVFANSKRATHFDGKPVVHLATTVWEPYVSTHERYHGMSYQIVKAVFEQQGYRVKIKFMDWDKAKHAVEKHHVDAIFPEYFSKENSKKFLYSGSFGNGPIGLYVKSDFTLPFLPSDFINNQKKLFDKLKMYHFGVVSGYTNVPAFDQNANLRKRYVSSDMNNLRQLFLGRVQLILIDVHTAHYLLNNGLPARYRENLKFLPPILGYKSLHVICSNKDSKCKALLGVFDQGFKKIKQNGTLTKILDEDARVAGSQLG